MTENNRQEHLGDLSRDLQCLAAISISTIHSFQTRVTKGAHIPTERIPQGFSSAGVEGLKFYKSR